MSIVKKIVKTYNDLVDYHYENLERGKFMTNRVYKSTPSVQNIKPPIAIGDILVTDNSFRYLNQKYTFNEIKHITFYWFTEFDESGSKTEKAFLEITLNNNQKLKERVSHYELKIFSFSKSSVKMGKKVETLAEACKLLLEKTFDNRFTYYVNQLKTDGYFVYDDKFFFYDGRVVSREGSEFRVTDNPKIDQYIMTLSKPENKYLSILLKTDRDVFLTLFQILLKSEETIKKHYDEKKINESTADSKFKNREEYEPMKAWSIKGTGERRQSSVSEDSNIITFWESKFKKS
jgi:hypothetical protein